jgi:hypothetical protein
MIRTGQSAQAEMELIISFGNGTLSKQLVPVPGSETFRNAWQVSVSAAEAPTFRQPHLCSRR